MTPAERSYLDELTLHLRLAGLDGREIGAIVEEARDHLESSGQPAEDAFGPAEEYAGELARSRDYAPARGLTLSRADLVAAAVQIGAWMLLVYSVAALGDPGGVEVLPGHLAGWAVLTAGLLWPVWPVLRAFLARRTGYVLPTLALSLVVGASVALALIWSEPVLLTVRPTPAILASLAVIAACWVRAWRLRDPVRSPVAGDERG